MKVSELIELLQELDTPDALVILSSDGEGNSFSPVSEGFGVGQYEADNTWSGSFYDQEEYGDLDPDEKPDTCDAVVIWPTN